MKKRKYVTAWNAVSFLSWIIRLRENGKIASTIDAFAAQGYEIQITELDVTDYDNSGKQLQYYKDLFNMLVTKKKNGVNITGVTFWGLCDSNSWRRSGKPLLFSAVFSPETSIL